MIKEGTIMVSLNDGRIKIKEMFIVFKNHEYKAYTTLNGWKEQGEFRLATKEEIKAYNRGIRHINDIKKETTYEIY